jgi:hypothetical protein
LLKPGRHIGIQFSPPPALTPPASKSILKINCKSPGCSECVLGLMTLTSLPPATINPYRRPLHRAFSIDWLIAWRWWFLIRRHSREDSNVEGDPRVKLSASAESSDSVPCKGRRRSVDGLLENSCVRVGRVKVDKTCMYNASSWTRSCASLSPNLLIATRYKGWRARITNRQAPAVNPFSSSLVSS